MTIKFSRFLLTACVALIGFSMKVATADEWNKEVIFRFTEPVQVPGKVLQPGKYIFRLADSSSNRNLVEIYSEDENGRQTFVAMIEAIPDYLVKTPEKPTINFEERHLGDPEAIKNWFYPGDNSGWSFAYPKSERLESASVAPPPAQPTVEPPPPPLAEPAASEPPAETAQDTPVLFIERETLISQVQLVPDPTGDSEPTADRVLPETAGHAAAFLFGGILALGSGLFVLSAARRKAQLRANL